MGLGDFLVQLSATFLGVILGFLFDRRLSDKQTEETLHNIVNSITLEIEMNEESIRKGEVLEPLSFVRTESAAFDSAVSGGYFSLLDAETQRMLASLYAHISFMNYFSDRNLLFKAIQGPDKIDLHSVLVSQYSDIKERYVRVLKHLKEKYPPSKTSP